MNQFDRRGFLDASLKASLGVALAGALSPQASQGEESKSAPARPIGRAKVGIFTKSFQDRSIEDVCRIFKGIGVDGLDLTVRKGGHIDPKDVATELPKAKQAAAAAGVEILFLTTNITEPDADAERVLATAAEQGIGRVKIGYYSYDQKKFGTLKQQIADVRARVEKVARLGQKHKVLPCIHIHSDAMIPSHGTLLYELIRDFSPGEVGAYADTLHMAKEGGGEGWRQGLDLLGPWLALCSIKNCVWVKKDRDMHGQQQWGTVTCPVADGICPIPEFLEALRLLNYSGPFSLHSEYKGKGSWQDLDTDGCIRQTAEDFAYVKPLL
nr:putative signal peptide prediction protein [uncultured bacterium]